MRSTTIAEPIPLKSFPGALWATLKKANLSQAAVARATGIPVSRINNYIQGKYSHIKMEHLSAICTKAATENGARGELLKTYLRDSVVGLPAEFYSLLFAEPVAPTLSLVGEIGFEATDRLGKRLSALLKRCGADPLTRSRTVCFLGLIEDSSFAPRKKRRATRRPNKDAACEVLEPPQNPSAP